LDLKQIEGSWTGVIKQYMKLFKGVPRKNISQSCDNQPDDPV
jgi:hypothetical protein